MTELSLDYESFGVPDLPKDGLDVYSQHPETEIIMAAYRIDRGRLNLAEITENRVPAELRDALEDPEVMKWAFNAQFERVMTQRVLKIKTPIRSWRCSMVLAYMLSFTGTLGDIGAQMGAPPDKAKLADGRRLIRKFSIPQKPTKAQPKVRIRPWDAPEDWKRFCDYCIRDVEGEEWIRDKALKYAQHVRYDWEWDLYRIDQVINDRGLPFDAQFARNTLQLADIRHKQLRADMRAITGLDNPNSVQALGKWLRERGYPFADLGKDSIKKVLGNLTEDPFVPEDGSEGYYLSEDVVTVLKLRQNDAKTSLRKHSTLLRVADHDKGVVRFLYQFAGASRTQRWAGRKVQTQNLPRTPKNIENYELLSQATELVRAGDYDALELFAGEVMNTLVGTVRSAFRAPEGYEFVVCDLSSIESCVIGWLFNCKRLLQVFRSGLDAYKDFATILYNVEYEEVTKEQRNICKPPVLGAGYRLGGGELTKEGKKTGLWGYAENMGIKLTQDESHKAVHVFRHAYHEIPKGWHDIEDKVEACVTTGISQRLGHLRFEMDGPFMKMILPSNRPIFYYKPQMRQMKWADGTPRKRLSFTYMGQHQKTGQWIRMENHGGRFTEQSVQGIARDVLAEGIKAAHAEEFRIVGHVHDEIKTLRRIGANRHDVAHLRECMIRPLAWAPGLPLNAAGWSGPIYRKD